MKQGENKVYDLHDQRHEETQMVRDIVRKKNEHRELYITSETDSKPRP